MTRPREQSGQLLLDLRTLGADALECPAIAIAAPADPAPLDAALGMLSEYDWLVFTSVNGVRAVMSRIAEHGGSGPAARLPSGLRVGAIGPATAGALRERGVAVDFVPDTYVAEAVVEQIGDVRGARVLLPRADRARASLPDGLRRRGAEVTMVTAYRTIAGAGAPWLWDLLAAGQIDAVTFTSSSTVRFFFERLTDGRGEDQARGALEKTQLVCIGPITASTARDLRLRVAAVAERYTSTGVVEALLTLFSGE